MQRRQKPERVELAARANAKLGQAIARAQNSLVAECKTILDSTFGGPGPPVPRHLPILFC